MRNAGLEEAQAGIKITGRNINNLRYTDDTTLMAESEEELKSLLMKHKTFFMLHIHFVSCLNQEFELQVCSVTIKCRKSKFESSD